MVRRVRSVIGGVVSRSGYLRKWLLLGVAIGVIAGLGAIVFLLALDVAGRYLLGDLGGYVPPEAVGDGGEAGSAGFTRPWAIPLVTCGGALASAWLVATLAPEAQGHGTDSAIEAVHTDPRGIRIRAVLVKLVASALTIGSGGSAGREGPTAQISAGFGSLLARTLDLSDHAGQLVWFLLIGVVAAAVGYCYVRVFYGTVALTGRLPGGPVVSPTVGGLLVGLLALLVPQVLGSGYGFVQRATTPAGLESFPLWVLLVLPLAKIVATSLSVGTGGSGGIFGPGIVIGGITGAAIWQLADLAGAPGLPASPGVFVVVAMMACFGSIAHAPLAVMIMVAEMTTSFAVLPGAMVAVGIAYLLISRTGRSMYTAQRRDRETAAAERRADA
ncbi:chloride channel protein [Mycobacterium sp. MYCO198283]|uniref:chloride channel protein n=1 Tax=Mycobacterium sp. MYCO198283 TaxID=2883505 RepID=UPI001E32A5D0|nr:chloride channel protein [Mycobacterium sp. MYCO198283]MCG5434489.1 chloride channel protein [Mycobacterium sp. MYCO198283]